MGYSNWVHLPVDEIVRESEKAFLMSIRGVETWVPKSQLDSPDRYDVGDADLEVSVTEWWARQAGLSGD